MRAPSFLKIYKLDALVDRVRQLGGSRDEFRQAGVHHLVSEFNFVPSAAEELCDRAWLEAG